MRLHANGAQVTLPNLLKFVAAARVPAAIFKANDVAVNASKSEAKPVGMTASKSEAKPVGMTASKSGAKPVGMTASKSEAKPVGMTASKSEAKPVVMHGTRPPLHKLEQLLVKRKRRAIEFAVLQMAVAVLAGFLLPRLDPRELFGSPSFVQLSLDEVEQAVDEDHGHASVDFAGVAHLVLEVNNAKGLDVMVVGLALFITRAEIHARAVCVFLGFL